MARTSQEQTQERHAFLLDLFRQQPDISQKEALASFKERFGGTINLKTFNQLREQAQGGLPDQSAAGEPSNDDAGDAANGTGTRKMEGAPAMNGASAPAPRTKAKGGRQRNIFIEAPQDQLAFLERVVQQIQDAGVGNLKIDHSTERWMVLVVDGK